jgi:hypothetical protein
MDPAFFETTRFQMQWLALARKKRFFGPTALGVYLGLTVMRSVSGTVIFEYGV